MTCKCGSIRSISVSAKCSDMSSGFYHSGFENRNVEWEGYVPQDINIGGGDYVEFEFCCDCGTILGFEPIVEEVLYESIKDC